MAKRNKKIHKTFHKVLFLSFIFLILTFVFMQFTQKSNDIIIPSKILNKSELLKLANTNLDVFKLTSRGADIVDGPRQANISDKEKFPALFINAVDPLYIMVLQSSSKTLIVVMNNTNVLKTVPFSTFS